MVGKPAGDVKILFVLCLGIQRPKNVFPEDPRSLGCSGHVRRGLKDQGSLQGERHPPRPGCPSGVALAPAPPAGAHHAPPAGLLHLPIRQEKDGLLPHQRQGHVLPALHKEQNCERDRTMVQHLSNQTQKDLNKAVSNRCSTSWRVAHITTRVGRTERRRESRGCSATGRTRQLSLYTM